MTFSLLAMTTLLGLCGPVRADDVAISPTGQILKATPRPGDVLYSLAQRTPDDPWPYQGALVELELQATMLSSSGAMAVVQDPEGRQHFVHLGTQLGDIQARVAAIGPGRIALHWETGSAVQDLAWCLLVLEQIAAPAAEGTADGGSGRPGRVTRLRQAACGPTSQLSDPGPS